MKITIIDLLVAVLFAFGFGVAATLWVAAELEVWRVQRATAGIQQGEV